MKTPIDWLRKELEYYREFEEFYTRHYLEIDAIFKEAKSMQNETIKFFYDKGHLYSGCEHGFEECYNKTFKK
jgi:hypothetical protein